MPQLKKKTEKEIKILSSFLDEENEEILKKIFDELLTLDEEGNKYLSLLIPDIENDSVKDKLNTIVIHNNFKLTGFKILKWLKSQEFKWFDLLIILNKIEQQELADNRIKAHYDKLLMDVWLMCSYEKNAFENAMQLRSYFFNSLNIKLVDDDKAHLKHFLLNEVFISKQTTITFLNVLYLCFACDLKFPVVPCLMDNLLLLAFENKPPYQISIFDSRFLFFIHNKTLIPYPESKLRIKYNINNDEELPCKPFSKKDVAVMMLKFLAHSYEKEKRNIYEICTQELIYNLSNE